uniref:Uncharacterized protein n=1 Tax=Rhizophora mucronata TaxID=61149 RepID=A0A2P2PQX6_RHIMU
MNAMNELGVISLMLISQFPFRQQIEA